jgi:hypothetical protein
MQVFSMHPACSTSNDTTNPGKVTGIFHFHPIGEGATASIARKWDSRGAFRAKS